MDRQDDAGFTLIELLVVVIIIGILAAIAIPSYLNARESGWRAAAESDLRNLAIQMETHLAVNDSYPADQAAFDTVLTAVEADLSPGVVPVGGAVSGVSYSLTGTGYCMSAGHLSIDGGATVVAAFQGGGDGLMASPTADCT